MASKKQKVCERCGSKFVKPSAHNPDEYTCLACDHQGESE